MEERNNPQVWEKKTSSGVCQKKMMKTQRNTAQMKEKGRNSQDQINEEEISNLPEREFRIMVIKMLQRLENTIEKMQETLTQLIESPRTKKK